MHGVVGEVGPWTFGWEAMVALATLALALATVILAGFTGWLALSTSKEVSSQSRPVLVAVDLSKAESITTGDGGLRIRVKNIGRGPAFGVGATLEPQGLAADHWSEGALEAGGSAVLRFSQEVGDADVYRLELTYKDLAKKSHRSKLSIERVPVKGAELEVVQRHAFRGVEVS